MRAVRWLNQHVYEPAKKTFSQFGLDDGYLLAAGVAYYVGLSLFPILWVLIGGLGAILRLIDPAQDGREEVLRVVAVNASPEVADQVGAVLLQFEKIGPPGGLVGIAIVLFTAGTLFAQFERAFDRIWRFTPPEDLGWLATLKSLLIERVTAFMLLMGIGALVVLTLFATTLLEQLKLLTDVFLPLPRTWWEIVQTATTVAVNTLAFGVLYHTMPRARVRWKEAFRGGLIVAIVWEAGRRVLTYFLIGDRYSVYGLVGALIAIQLWAFYAVTVILLGAEYVRVTCKYCSSEAAAEMNRRRFWQLMTRMYARKSQDKSSSSPGQDNPSTRKKSEKSPNDRTAPARKP